MSSLKLISSSRSFSGSLSKYSFPSSSLSLSTNINIFLPSSASPSTPVPVIYYLAGLTCTEDTGAQKGAFLGAASKAEVAVVFVDTSPRGADVQGEEKDWDFGTGAGFYLNADKPPYEKNYKMYDLVVREIPEVLEKEGLGIDGKRVSLMGHSMGGHGALSIYLKNPGKYRSTSGLAPICNPTNCQWGQKAFEGYFNSPSSGSTYDSTILLSSYPTSEPLNIKIDYGTADQFHRDGQLRVEVFEEEVKKLGRGKEVDVGRREGYDHSYYFVSTFASEHVEWHAKHLKA